MSLNFFKGECKSNALTHKEFGLCDPEDGSKAYVDVANPNTWVAHVFNQSGLEVIFTAIDKCVIQDDEHEGRGRCDGMLTTSQHLFLVELKDTRQGWETDAKGQLLSTIDFLTEAHDISHFKKRKAFACNKKRKHFAYIDNEENLALYRRTGFRLDVQAKIVVV